MAYVKSTTIDWSKYQKAGMYGSGIIYSHSENKYKINNNIVREETKPRLKEIEKFLNEHVVCLTYHSKNYACAGGYLADHGHVIVYSSDPGLNVITNQTTGREEILVNDDTKYLEQMFGSRVSTSEDQKTCLNRLDVQMINTVVHCDKQMLLMNYHTLEMNKRYKIKHRLYNVAIHEYGLRELVYIPPEGITKENKLVRIIEKYQIENLDELCKLAKYRVGINQRDGYFIESIVTSNGVEELLESVLKDIAQTNETMTLNQKLVQYIEQTKHNKAKAYIDTECESVEDTHVMMGHIIHGNKINYSEFMMALYNVLNKKGPINTLMLWGEQDESSKLIQKAITKLHKFVTTEEELAQQILHQKVSKIPDLYLSHGGPKMNKFVTEGIPRS